MSLMASFCAVLSLRDVLDEIWDLIGSVCEGCFLPTLKMSQLFLGLLSTDFRNSCLNI